MPNTRKTRAGQGLVGMVVLVVKGEGNINDGESIRGAPLGGNEGDHGRRE